MVHSSPYLLLLVFILTIGACRDPEEAALHDLEEDGFGFAVSDFHRAAAQGDVAAVEKFLKAGMAVDVEGEDGQTAFQRAAAMGEDGMVRYLVEAGASTDQRLDGGRTLLIEIAGRTDGDLAMLDFLLEHHADAKAMDAQNLTALMVGAMAGNVDAVRRLAMRDVRSLDKAFLLAAAQGHTHCLEALIEFGAYVNCRSHDGQTPLMYAAGKGHAEAVKLLLRHHANRFAMDESGKTASERAEAASYATLAEILRDTSDLVPPKVPANNEFVPSLDGQLIAFLSDADPEIHAAAIEPHRPLLDPLNGPPEETAEGSNGGNPPAGATGTSPKLPVGRRADEQVPVNTTTGGARGRPTASVDEETQPTASNDPASVSPVNVDLPKELRLGRFNERFEPILITDVTDKQAKVRLLHRPTTDANAIVMVMVGERIPDTSYEVQKVTKRVRPAKGGGTVDVSEVMVQDRVSQEEQRFVRGTLPRDADTHLVVETRRSHQRFAARLGDVFTVAETEEQYAVSDIRPHQLVVRNLTSGDVLTINRG